MAKKGLGKTGHQVQLEAESQQISEESLSEPKIRVIDGKGYRIGPVTEVELSSIIFNPLNEKTFARKDDETIEELAQNIKQYGLINPVIVVSEGQVYKLIAGHRRVMAYRRLDKKSIPARKAMGYDSSSETLLLFIENFHRQDHTYEQRVASYREVFKGFDKRIMIEGRGGAKERSKVSVIHLNNQSKPITAELINQALGVSLPTAKRDLAKLRTPSDQDEKKSINKAPKAKDALTLIMNYSQKFDKPKRIIFFDAIHSVIPVLNSLPASEKKVLQKQVSKLM